MYCPTCKNSFDADVKECPTDNAALVGELPYQTIPREGGSWVEIASASTSDEAQLLQGFLQAEGIESEIESLKFSMEPINFGSLGEIRVFVPSEDEAKAIELLRQRESEYEKLDDEDDDDGVVVTDDGPATIEDGAQADTEAE